MLEVARREGALVTLHCENHDAINWMTEKLLSAGLTDPKYFAWSKPAVCKLDRPATPPAFISVAEVLLLVYCVLYRSWQGLRILPATNDV